MTRSDRADATIEIILASLFYSQRLKIRKKAYRLIIARWVAAFDPVFNLAPDAGTALFESLQPNAARFFGLRCLAAPFRFTALGVDTLTFISEIPSDFIRILESQNLVQIAKLVGKHVSDL